MQWSQFASQSAMMVDYQTKGLLGHDVNHSAEISNKLLDSGTGPVADLLMQLPVIRRQKK